MHDAKVQQIAAYLADGRMRFMEDGQIGYLRGKFKASRDQVRTAAILADRIRRQRQTKQHGPSFKVTGMVEPDAPITLSTPGARPSKVEAAAAMEQGFRKWRAHKSAVAAEARQRTEAEEALRDATVNDQGRRRGRSLIDR